ncbi:uracil-DNA glycosylase [Phaeovibrio sulfidiphilus]|uniref:Uracil-DNA glycosylase n=1 Tax=Phaeovibrio sulfidiphilus TaxID=1220600 RepID=A0A8J6YNN6_9PROT|nr:uracil-DNA glycosylase [Phaeovibrio sulfidiphilus]MBE1237895.1 uracil-DNA glycosylase [Phaeovibrio sulfidiphilus]
MTPPPPLQNPDWIRCLDPVLQAPWFRDLVAFVDAERRQGKQIFPPPDRVFHALEATPPDAVRVVILGQDPYHGAGQAHGLAFSVPDGVRVPPSLRNIFKERERDLGLPPPKSGNLEHWAAQGVLLLNTSLTVEESSPGSHAKRGWERFTDAVVETVARSGRPVVFLLWGNHARSKRPLIGNADGILVLEAAHPSPLSASRGFLGCGHLSQANAFLADRGLPPVQW